jgi:hypothetical protein
MHILALYLTARRTDLIWELAVLRAASRESCPEAMEVQKLAGEEAEIACTFACNAALRA